MGAGGAEVSNQIGWKPGMPMRFSVQFLFWTGAPCTDQNWSVQGSIPWARAVRRLRRAAAENFERSKCSNLLMWSQSEMSYVQNSRSGCEYTSFLDSAYSGNVADDIIRKHIVYRPISKAQR